MSFSLPLEHIPGQNLFNFIVLHKKILFIYFIIHLFTCAYIVWFISPPCPLPPPTLLLVYDSYTGSYIVTFSYTHVLYSELFHPLHYSPFNTILLLNETLTAFNVPFTYLFRKYINYIHHFILLFCPPPPTSAVPLI
jgi:hypothetical protein